MRKGISTIIATILLVVIAIILVGIILSWSQTFVHKTTANADSTIDTSCNGASIDVINCDYNSASEELKLTIINSGSIVFREDYNFNITLIDAANDLNNENLNVLGSLGLGLGESTQLTLGGYTGTPPIKLELRTNQCNGYFWSKTCS
jgi:flagellin-like protein